MSVIEVTVKSQKGKCVFGHRAGDKIVFNGRTVEGPICLSALSVLMPKIYAMRFGAEFPWEKEKNVVHCPCPDSENPVVFEIRRMKKK
ncbi:MAG TPA: TIGR04076 family protein [Patescibacteria group bacterium]|nr:TIGR04076 family protein [Patescibacteria group bacterium]